MEALQLLLQHPIFGRAERARLVNLADTASVRHLVPKAHLVRPGDAVTGVFALIRGAIVVTRLNIETRMRMLIGMMDAPGVIGDAELFSGARRFDYSIRATTSTSLIHLPAGSLVRWLATEPAVALGLYQDSAARLSLALELMHVFALQSIEQKILRLLHSVSTERATDKARVAPLSPTRLAAALGVSVRTIARYLNVLEKNGSLRREEGCGILLVSPEAIRDPSQRTMIPAKWRLPLDGKARTECA